MTRLEKATHVALIVVCCIATYVLISQRTNWFRPGPRPPVRVGQRLDLPGERWASAPMTLVLAINSQCRFCEESLPLYRKLCGSRGSPPRVAYRVIAVSEEPWQSLAGFLHRNGLGVDAVVSTPLDRLGIRGTPTVLVADSAGVVRSIFIGKLAEAREGALIKAVEASCTGCGR